MATVAACTIASVAMAQEPALLAARPGTPRYWRTVKNCGINALYMLAKASGKEVTYDDVFEATHAGPDGTSLQDLTDACGTLGIECEALAATKSGLERLSPPFVVHMASLDGENRGHYLIVTGIDISAHRVHFVDGALATQASMDYAEFLKRWTGSVLVVTAHGSLSLVAALCAVAAGFLAAAFVTRARPGRSS